MNPSDPNAPTPPGAPDAPAPSDAPSPSPGAPLLSLPALPPSAPPGFPPQGVPPYAQGPYHPPPQGMAPNPYLPPPPQGMAPDPYLPPPIATHSRPAIVALVLSLTGVFAGMVPYFEAPGEIGLFTLIGALLGASGFILGLIARNIPSTPNAPRRYSLVTPAILLGMLAGFNGFLCVPVVNWFRTASCPHVYAFDGRGYRLDGDLASGALYAAGERDDLDRMESLAPVDGEYRLRVANDLQEIDHINRVSLVVVDAPAEAEVLPTPAGTVAALRHAAAPIAARDVAGGDVLPALAAADGRAVSASARSGRDTHVRWRLSFARPTTRRAWLVVRGHSTPFAEAAFMRYLATMGRGVRPLLESLRDDPACYRRELDAEIARLGFPLRVKIDGAGALSLPPVSPAIARSQAVAVELPAGDGPVSLTLEATDRFWELDQVQLASREDLPVETRTLRPEGARYADGRDARAVVSDDDTRRAVLRTGEHVDVTFRAPPNAPGRVRTALVSLRGFYEFEISGPWAVNLTQVVAHRLGVISLPEFARGLPTARAP